MLQPATPATAFAVPPQELRWTCPESLVSSIGANNVVGEYSIGQERALKAIELAAAMKNKSGYNMFVTGIGGTRAIHTVDSLLQNALLHQSVKQTQKILQDILLIYNFASPDTPEVCNSQPRYTHQLLVTPRAHIHTHTRTYTHTYVHAHHLHTYTRRVHRLHTIHNTRTNHPHMQTLFLPSGEGQRFKKDMEKLVNVLNTNLPQIFER